MKRPAKEQCGIEKVIEAKIDMAIKAYVLNEGKDYEKKVIDLRKRILSIPELGMKDDKLRGKANGAD